MKNCGKNRINEFSRMDERTSDFIKMIMRACLRKVLITFVLIDYSALIKFIVRL